MAKNYNQFKQDVDIILNNDNSELHQLQSEWANESADEHLNHYKLYNVEKAFASFLKKAKQTQNEYGVDSVRPLISHKGWIYIIGIAASIAILIGIAMLWPRPSVEVPSRLDKIVRLPSANDSLPRIILANGSRVKVINGITVGGVTVKINQGLITLQEADDGQDDNVTMEEIVIPRGKMYKLSLMDGTKVLLNSGSSLRFPSRFVSSRNVELKGQAFFEVAKDGRTFNVITSKGKITVLGTSFSVYDYANRQYCVTLTTGRIRFRNDKTDATITAGQSIICDKSGNTTITTVKSQEATAWMDGLIEFDNTTLGDIMDDISRMYDVRVHFASKRMRDMRFTGECSRFHSVDEILSVLSMTDDFAFDIDGRDIYIHSTGKNNDGVVNETAH